MADIICPVLSCKDCKIDGLIKDPHLNAKAFDEEGYRLLTALRIQGISKMTGIIQDLQEIPQNKQSLVKKFFQRYFESELGTDDKYITFESNENVVRTLVRLLQGLTPTQMEWREKKGYMLIERININNNVNGGNMSIFTYFIYIYIYIRGNMQILTYFYIFHIIL